MGKITSYVSMYVHIDKESYIKAKKPQNSECTHTHTQNSPAIIIKDSVNLKYLQSENDCPLLWEWMVLKVSFNLILFLKAGNREQMLSIFRTLHANLSI